MQRILPELRLVINTFMKQASLLLFIPLFPLLAMAQKYDSWKIFHNRKEVASFNLKKESTDERKVLLLNRSLEDPGFFIIKYSPASAQADWIRSISICDSSDKELKKYDNVLFLRLHNTEASRIITAGGGQKIKVYSWAIPKDPALAATVRVRRLLLCTIYTR
jgi:hypothetical protein